MNRKDIQELRIHAGYPAITIIMPCETKAAQEALKKILDTLTEESVSAMIKNRSEELLAHFNCPIPGTKVALFIDKHRARAFMVPAATPDIVACDTTFKLDALLTVMNYTFRYWVIDCTAEVPVLLEGMADIINKLSETCTSFTDQECSLAHNKNRCFDTCFTSYLEQDRLPIVIVGSAEQTLRLRLLAPYTDLVAVRVEAQADVWPAIQRWHAAEIEKFLKRVATGLPGQDYLTDINEILVYARQGDILQLVIEEGYARPGCEHPITRAVLFNQSCPHDYVAISAIEQIVESVRSKGGTILIVPDGSLLDYGRMIGFLSHA